MIVGTDVEAQLDGTDCRLVNLELSRDRQRVDSLGGSRPDQKWAVRDEAGHIHRWYGDTIPTVTTETVTKFCWDCDEEHDETTYRCRWCQEQIFPVYIATGPESTWIDGPATITATVEYPIGLAASAFGERLLLTTSDIACVMLMTDMDTASVGDDMVTVQLVGVEEPMRRP